MKSTRAFVRLLLAALALGSAAPSVHATTLALGQASSFNVYVLGDMKESYTDSQGRVAVAGNATLTGYGVGSSFSGNPSAAGTTLVVGGSLAYNNGEIHYGSVAYGGTMTGSNYGIPNGTAAQGSPLDFTATNNYLTSTSSYLAGLVSNGATSDYHGGVHLVGSDPTLNIFTLSGAALANAWGVVIDAPAGSTVLVNVTGTTSGMQNMGLNFQDLNGDGTGMVGRQNVIYNFNQATSLTLGGVSVQGSILAPNATVNFNNGNIEGQLIAGNLIGSGEAHNYLFQGSLPGPTQIPEPSSVLLVGLAGGMWAMRRKRGNC